MQHLSAYFEDVDQAGAAGDIAAVPDASTTVSGDFVRCPDELPFLLGAAYVSIVAAYVGSRVESPSLRQLANFDLGAINGIATPAVDPRINWIGANPQPLTPGEDVSFNVTSNGSGDNEIYGLVWFGDGPQQAVNGDIFTVRCTWAVTAVATVWTPSSLVFTQDLPVGNYDVVGLRVSGAGLIAGRLSFVGGAWRPGVLAAITDLAGDTDNARFGAAGILGSFHQRNPPQVEVIGITATSGDCFLDLIKRS